MLPNRSKMAETKQQLEPLRVALISGITGQDGSYLTEFLLAKGYEVHGIIRRSSNFNTQRLEHLYIDPHNSSAPLTLRLLEAVRNHIETTGRKVKYYQAGSSEMYGATPPPQDETTIFHPRSPYAVSKVVAHWYTVNYREAYGLFACNGILFNHESRRRENSVTRKITRAVGRIKIGLQKKLFLGNLQASRDWGFAGDYVEAMWLMLQQDKPDDYVVATEDSHTVEEFLEAAFGYVGLNWKDYVAIDPREALGWKPKVDFKQLVPMMVKSNLERAKREKVLADKGFLDAHQQP
ncbi:hypothetical protein R1flu_022190 [Riccia fluitans]|uniref:GDP-mannose 4,6-dehydratase n=1 Tax=Riccia fluitans TaxID=41844 RepID=A0ABD1ZRI7_9MARC